LYDTVNVLLSRFPQHPSLSKRLACSQSSDENPTTKKLYKGTAHELSAVALIGGCRLSLGDYKEPTQHIACQTAAMVTPVTPAFTAFKEERQAKSVEARSKCNEARDASLRCIEAHYEDKGKCSPLFREYKSCKKAESDAVVAERRARNAL